MFVEADALEAATGWALKPQGLCRGEVCVPLLGRGITNDDGRVDLVAWAEALALPLAYDEGVAAFTTPVAGLRPEIAPDLTLPDVAGRMHSFSEGRGSKRVLTTWASWCGCRHELAAWQALHEELAPQGLRLFSVALDEPDQAAPWIEAAGLTFPAVIDSRHVTADHFGIVNVPSTVWVDEDDRIVKPPTIAPGDDQFVDFTQVPAERHHEALRRWVATGEVPSVPDQPPRTHEQQLGLAHRRVAAFLHEHGRPFVHQLERAAELSPMDWTVRRSGIAMKGQDPFLGEEFIAFWSEWDAAGRPGYVPTT
ncbi:MAG TPA: TlpA disulfide reductase family protein [Nocardioidaceae bacterium]|nr:TlpA disulfide reductase family protein [Nocardioidaceae bacterium]